MSWRELVKSKTFWAGLASIATGVGMLLNGQSQEGAQLIGAGVLAICLRDGVAKAGK